MSAATSPIDKLFSSIPSLPSIPRVVQELIASLGDEDIDIGTLVKQVKQDQSLSARVLRLANSSYYGASHKIGAIDDAVTVIGLNALRTLVIASGVTGAFTTLDGMDMKHFWRHSMVSAGVARALGKRAGVNAEFAYTAGLMHRMGLLLIHLAYPEVGKQLAHEGDKMGAASLVAIEHALIQTDHCEIGAELARRWNFPAVIANALRWYANPLAEQACPHAAVVALSAQIAQGLLSRQPVEAIAADLSGAVLERIVVDRDDVMDQIEACRPLAEMSDQLL